jgi:hypothetical protein
LLPFRTIIIFVVTLATLLYAIPSNSKDDIEDLVDIEQVGGQKRRFCGLILMVTLVPY